MKAKMNYAILTLTVALLSPGAVAAKAKAVKSAGEPKIVVHKSPTCGCCGEWEKHLKREGFKVESRITENMSQKKTELGVPQSVQSCHTAVVDGYVVEGHVPAASIRKLLKEKPKIKGIAVPGMPVGSPGMEGPHPEKYEVVTFGGDGKTKVYDRY
jgi:hypothetical protein